MTIILGLLMLCTWRILQWMRASGLQNHTNFHGERVIPNSYWGIPFEAMGFDSETNPPLVEGIVEDVHWKSETEGVVSPSRAIATARETEAVKAVFLVFSNAYQDVIDFTLTTSGF